eukprot:366251-Chlamydomonas_euryale.AAC.2
MRACVCVQAASNRSRELLACWKYINQHSDGQASKRCATHVRSRVVAQLMPSATGRGGAASQAKHAGVAAGRRADVAPGADATPVSPSAHAKLKTAGSAPMLSPAQGGGGTNAASGSGGTLVQLACAPSTGDATRDRTVCALYSALSCASSAVDLADTAAALEAAVHDASRGVDGDTAAPAAAVSPGPAYLKRAFLVWGLLSPESDAFSADVAELLLEGILSPQALAGLELGDAGGAAGAEGERGSVKDEPMRVHHTPRVASL